MRVIQSERRRTSYLSPAQRSDVGERIEVEPLWKDPGKRLGPVDLQPYFSRASRKLISPRHQATRAASGPRTHTGSGKPEFR